MKPASLVPRCSLALALAVPALGACQLAGDGDGPELASARQPIINGNTATVGQFPTVVAIRNNGLCTGTLVAPDIVLTAAHCIHPATLGLSSPAQVTARTEVVLDTIDATRSGGRVIAARDTVVITAFAEPGDPDVGLIFLAQAVTDRAPTPLNLTPAGAQTGVAVTMVGYGETASGSVGRLLYTAPKSSVSCAGFGVNNALFLCFDQRSGPGICSGDSGGPALAEVDGVVKVVGVTSFGDRDCTVLGAHMRTDAIVTRDFLQAHAPELLCRADGACDAICGTAGLAPDPDCAPSCASDAECGEGYCGNGDTCLPAPYAPGGIGSACASNDECATGQCATDGEQALCAESCLRAGSSCPDGFDCKTGLCWPRTGCDAGGGGLGGAAALALLALVRRLRPRRRAVA